MPILPSSGHQCSGVVQLLGCVGKEVAVRSFPMPSHFVSEEEGVLQTLQSFGLEGEPCNRLLLITETQCPGHIQRKENKTRTTYLDGNMLVLFPAILHALYREKPGNQT